jgi:hypothetical protein
VDGSRIQIILIIRTAQIPGNRKESPEDDLTIMDVLSNNPDENTYICGV